MVCVLLTYTVRLVIIVLQSNKKRLLEHYLWRCVLLISNISSIFAAVVKAKQKQKTELCPFYQRGIYGISEMAFVTGPAPGTGCGRAAPALMSPPLDWEQSRVEAEEWTVMEVSGQNSFAWMWRQHRGESRTHSIWYAPSQWMYLYHNMWAFLYQTFVGKSNILSKTEAFFEDVWKVFSII